MKAIVQTGPREIELDDVEKPEVSADEVLVEVHSAGICGSDAGAYAYEEGYEWLSFPRVMGHEYSGKVVDVGNSVTNYDIGDKVIEEPVHNCGKCLQCKNGEPNVCQSFSVIGLHENGAYVNYRAVNHNYLHKVPKDVPLELAAITEPTSVASRAVNIRSGIRPGDDVLVEGPGPIGSLIALISEAIGANVLVSGIDRDSIHRLPILDKLGISTVDVTDQELNQISNEFTAGSGFDAVFDATGHHTGIESAIEVVRKGGEIIVVGLPNERSDIFLTEIVRGEIDVKTSYGSLWSDFEQALRIIDRNLIDATPLLDNSASILEPEKAFQSFLSGKSCKPIFTFGS